MTIAPSNSWEIQLFEPPEDAIYTIEATSHLVNASRRRILVYCKHHLVSPANGTAEHGYYFDRDAIHTLRRIETLRTVCGDDFAGIKMILDLTAASVPAFSHLSKSHNTSPDRELSNQASANAHEYEKRNQSTLAPRGHQ